MPVVLSGTNGVTFPDSSLQAAAASPYVLKNRIINGDMRIDQRNAGASVTPANGATTYTVDRWAFFVNQASKLTAQQSTTAPVGFVNSLKVTSSSAYTVGSGDLFILQQAIEGLNVSDLAWGTANAKTITLSFWVYSSLTGTFGGSLMNSSQNRSYPFTYTISSANTWEQKTITIAGDTSGTWLTTNGVGIFVFLGMGIGSTYSGTAGSWAGATYFGATGATSVVGTNGATLYITGVQLEIGTSATPFERRLYGQELALCQRYYQQNTGSFGYTWSTTAGAFGFAFNQTMRAAPTLGAVNTSTGSIVDPGSAIRTMSSVGSTDLSSTNGICANINISTTSNNKGHSINGNTVSFSAEL